MRVIAGTAGRVELTVAPGTMTRPMLEKARGGLANALSARIDGARVLDLYAGSGALGLEMLSRGAALAVFVERDPKAAAALRENIGRCGCADRSLVLTRAAGAAVHALRGAGLRRRPTPDAPPGVEPAAFELVFLDPPFAQAARWADDPEGQRIVAGLPPLMAPGGVVLFRLEGRRVPPPDWPGLALVRDQRYGRSRICWYTPSTADK